MYSLSDYTYTLPEELIAQTAIHPYHNARLMVIDRSNGKITNESIFWDLSNFIPKNRVIFFNNSRVLPARIRLTQNTIEQSHGNKHIIKDGEILFLQKQSNDTFEALIRPGKKLKIGTKIYFSSETYLEIISKTDKGRILRSHGAPIETIMHNYGELPLPPYIKYAKEKENDYQTIFAEVDGSVAAPTASLHFTNELMEQIKNEKVYLTLHVGLGTFQPINTSDVRNYQIHSELIKIDMQLLDRIAEIKKTGKKILAVGTTACRTLESLPYVWQGLSMNERGYFRESTRSYWDTLTKNLEPKNFIHSRSIDYNVSTITYFTSIYIYPGYIFLMVDDLITNFHLPQSSLLVLVSAFLGREHTLKIYEYAIKKQYRFLSFGDGMYIRGRG